MSERYLLDISTNTYLDREWLVRGLAHEKNHDELAHRHNNEGVIVGKKRLNPFRLYAMSNLRTDVATADMFPGEEPASIIRCSPVHGILRDRRGPAG